MAKPIPSKTFKNKAGKKDKPSDDKEDKKPVDTKGSKDDAKAGSDKEGDAPSKDKVPGKTDEKEPEAKGKVDDSDDGAPGGKPGDKDSGAKPEDKGVDDEDEESDENGADDKNSDTKGQKPVDGKITNKDQSNGDDTPDEEADELAPIQGKNTLTGKPKEKIDTSPSDHPVKEHVVVTVGRMNPPTRGHAALIENVKNIAARTGSDAKVFLTHTMNDKTDPLTYAEKLHYCKIAFGDIINESSHKDLVSLFTSLAEKYENVTVVVGDDQYDSFAGFFHRCNGKDFTFGTVTLEDDVRPIIENGEYEISASKMREYAIVGRLDLFEQGLPERLQPLAKRIMVQVQHSLLPHKSPERIVRDIMTRR